MMKKFFLAIILFIPFITTINAQTTREEMFGHKERMASNYLAYPLDFKPQTKVPKGYEPFYISHYGRHGSRYHYNSADFKNLYDILSKADSVQSLTPLGKDVMNRLYLVYQDSKQKSGDLTQKGAAQHRGIAKRMYESFPEVFAKKAKIDAKSTTSVRCVLSMEAFCLQLKEMNPSLQITNEASKRLATYLMYEDKADTEKRMSDTLWTKPFSALHAKLIHPERMMQSLFSNQDYVSKNVDAVSFMRKLYELSSSMQGMDSLNISFDDVFTTEELFNNWQVQNAWWYGNSGPSPLTLGKNSQYGKNLLKNILDEADKAISGTGDNVTLRFGHDMGIMPLAGLMQLEGCYTTTTDLENLYKVWTDYKIIPMAANFQLILFKNKKTNDILVKILLNENEVKLPIKSDLSPYYYWSDFEDFCRSLLK